MGTDSEARHPDLQYDGFDNVKGYSGSYLAWTDAGEPIETP
jgi:rhodanese-related sulfurtransferase